MKSVSMIRLKLPPLAECQHMDCGWTFQGSPRDLPSRVRNQAQQHVKAYGHIVTVTVRDITEYAPGVTP